MKTTTLFIKLFKTAIVLIFLQLLFALPAAAQFSLDQPDFNQLLNTEWELQIEFSTDYERIISLIEQTGEDQLWDFSQLEPNDTVSSSGTMHFLSEFSDKPGSEDEHFENANVMIESDFQMTFIINGDEVQMNWVNYGYGVINDTSLVSLGVYQSDSGDPDEPTHRSYFTPGDVDFKFPLTYETTWEYEYESNFEAIDDDFGDTSQSYSVVSEVDGWGQIQTGNETIDVLRITKTETNNIMGFEYSNIEVQFINENGLQVAILDTEENQDGEGYDEESTDGQLILYSETESVSEEIEETTRPSSVQLRQNYPNPFNPATQISYDLNQPASVTLNIYSLTGQKVKTLVNNQLQQAGTHSVTFDAANFASGIYIYRLSTGDQTFTRKMTLLK